MNFCTELCLSEEVLFTCLNGLGCSQNAGKLHSESTNFQIFLGEHISLSQVGANHLCKVLDPPLLPLVLKLVQNVDNPFVA